MTPQIADKIIAAFMGMVVSGNHLEVDSNAKNSKFNAGCKLYHQSLDALVPVWRKIGAKDPKHPFDFSVYMDFYGNKEVCGIDGCPVYRASSGDIFQAAAIATAKTIQKLGGNE